jgi:ribosome recycling factor
MPFDDIVLEAEEKMEKALEVLVQEFKGVRTGRATPGLVEGILVEYYGSPTNLKQLATITIPDARMIVLKPFDPGSLGEIEKAIQKSNLGINPANDGKVIRLAIPPLSEERRKQMVKMAKDMAEKAKVSIRSVRRDSNTQADKEEKEKILTEDEKFKAKEEIQRLTEQYEKKGDEALEKKTKEIMEV